MSEQGWRGFLSADGVDGIWMQELNPEKPLRHAMHVDVSVAREQVDARLAAALAAGGRIVRRLRRPWQLDPRGPRRRPSLHLRMARRIHTVRVRRPAIPASQKMAD